jgi:hypothetical protein
LWCSFSFWDFGNHSIQFGIMAIFILLNHTGAQFITGTYCLRFHNILSTSASVAYSMCFSVLFAIQENTSIEQSWPQKRLGKRQFICHWHVDVILQEKGHFITQLIPLISVFLMTEGDKNNEQAGLEYRHCCQCITPLSFSVRTSIKGQHMSCMIFVVSLAPLSSSALLQLKCSSHTIISLGCYVGQT